MLEYHKAWLEVHPQRSEEWLSNMLRDGFDIHHIDGNHSNNKPENLVLIESSDHQELHGHKKWAEHLRKLPRHLRTRRVIEKKEPYWWDKSAIRLGKSRGGKTAGDNAVKNKTGIHALSSKEKQEAGIKGKSVFLDKWKDPEFQKLHIMKIKLGKIIKRFNRIPRPVGKNFGFI